MAALAILLLAAVVLVEVARLVRDTRRGRRLNRALHELRRPLQSIALTLESSAPDLVGAGACLEQARHALRELDDAVNGGRSLPAIRAARVGEVVAALERRWSFADVEVQAPEVDRAIEADVDRLGAALDNLVANALRHGTGIVRVRALSGEGRTRFEVRDDGPSTAPSPSPDRRHGHGLGVVADVASGHGGSLLSPSPTRAGGTVAAISLPSSRGVAGR